MGEKNKLENKYTSIFEENNMKTKVIVEQPIFTLTSSSYNSNGEPYSVTVEMLKRADVGKKWESRCYDNCGRDAREETIELVYKTEHGCACLYRSFGTTDSPDPEYFEETPELIWVEFIIEAD